MNKNTKCYGKVKDKNACEFLGRMNDFSLTFSIVLFGVFCVSNGVLALSIPTDPYVENMFFKLSESISVNSAMICLVAFILGIIDFIRVKINLKKNNENVKKRYKEYFFGALIAFLITLIISVLIITEIIPLDIRMSHRGIYLGFMNLVLSCILVVFIISLIIGIINFIKVKMKKNEKNTYRKFLRVALEAFCIILLTVGLELLEIVFYNLSSVYSILLFIISNIITIAFIISLIVGIINLIEVKFNKTEKSVYIKFLLIALINLYISSYIFMKL